MRVFNVSPWWCYTFICRIAFSFRKPFVTVMSLFLSERGLCRDFNMLGQPNLAGTSILELCVQQSPSEKVLLASRTAIQHGHVHLPCPSLLMWSVIYSLWLARRFVSAVVNQLRNSSPPLWEQCWRAARAGSSRTVRVSLGQSLADQAATETCVVLLSPPDDMGLCIFLISEFPAYPAGISCGLLPLLERQNTASSTHAFCRVGFFFL